MIIKATIQNDDTGAEEITLWTFDRTLSDLPAELGYDEQLHWALDRLMEREPRVAAGHWSTIVFHA